MTGFELLLGSTVMAAAPTVPTPWFLSDDYPVQAFDRRWEGATGFQLVIDPTGRAVGCSVETSSGHEMLDKRACSIAVKRARFQPATNSEGHAAYGVYRSRINWAVDPAFYAQSEYGPDFEVSVSRLPDGAPVSVKYAVEVNASGAPVACNAITSGHADELNALGCAKIKQDYRKAVALAGAPIAAVQTAWITFTQ